MANQTRSGKASSSSGPAPPGKCAAWHCSPPRAASSPHTMEFKAMAGFLVLETSAAAARVPPAVAEHQVTACAAETDRQPERSPLNKAVIGKR